MNLFDNIIQTSKNNFLGTKPIVPSTPIFTTPQAPRTSSYIAPNTPYTPSKPSMSLFSDEKQMFQKMKADNLSDDTAYSMLKKRRMDILGWNDLANDEKSMLLKMQADNVPVKEAVSLIQKRRADQFNKKYKEGNLLQKWAYNTLAFAAGNLETLAKYSGNTLDFITGGTMWFGDEVKKMEQVTSSPEFSESSAFTAGTYLPDVALAVSPIGWWYMAGAKWMTGLQWANLFSKVGAKNLTQWLMGRSAVVGAGFGATQPILEQWSDVSMWDIATGAGVWAVWWAIAAPVFWKALKYWQAGYYGGLTGAGKSIARDVKWGLQAITPSGANISTKANRFNASEIRNFIKTTGQSPWDFATSRGMTKVWDDAVVEATNLWQKSKDQADEALKTIKWRFRFTDEWEDLLKTTLDDLETRLVNTKSPDYKRISQLKAKYEDTGLTMSEINEIKRAYSNNYKYSFVDAGSESALRSRNLQDAVRNWQFKVAEENGLTNLKDINKTTQWWKMFADSLSKKIQGSSGNNNVSLTDWIALSGGSPENIALYLGKKLASSDTVKSGAIKLFSKKTKPSIIQASKADIQQANFKKDVNRGVSGVGDNSGGKSMVRPVGLIEAPKGKATGAKNVRVNQPIEKAPIKNEWQVWVRPWTKANIKIPESVQLAKQTQRQEQFRQVERDLNTALLSKYNPNKPKATKEFLDRAITQGRITKEEAITLVENLYEKADWWNKPHYERMLNDLYSNKKIESWDDLLNEKQVKTVIKTPRQEFIETPEGIYREIQKKANDRRYNPDKADALIAKFKEKTGIDLMTEKTPNFDKDWNVVKVIKKPTPNTIKNESKVSEPVVAPKNDTPIIKKPIVNTDKNTNYVGRKDLIWKLSPEDAVIQSWIDSGWLWITGWTSLKDLNPRQRKYLYDSATSAFFSNDPVFTQRINAYTRPSKPIVKPNTIKNESKVTPSQTQANWPRVIWKMGKVETKTSPQSATSYEAGMRRPFTMWVQQPTPKRLFAGDNSAQPKKLSNPLVEEVKDLAVLHNLSIEKIKKINELWGLPWPSLAVTKKSIPFEDFGDITLVWDKDLIQSMKAKTYSADIYSPRVPQPDYIPKKNSIIKSDLLKLDSEVKEYWSSWLNILEDLIQWEESNSIWLLTKFAKDNWIKINKVNKKAYYWGWFDWYEYVARMTPEKLSKYVTNNRNQNNDIFVSDMQKVIDNIVKDNFPWEKSPKMYFWDSDRLYMYLKDSQKWDIYDSIWTARWIRDIIDEKWLRNKYNNFTEELKNTLADKMLYKWRNNHTWAKKYTAYSLDNVIKEMFSKWNQWAESSIFQWNLSQTMWKEAKALTIPQIKKSSFWSSKELDAKYQSLKDEWSNIVWWDGASAINESFTSKWNPESILRKLHEYSDWTKFTLSDIKRLQEIATEATNLPKTYLETKFTRSVWLKEFRWVIAPVEQIPELKQLLKWTGLEDKIVWYKQWESRMWKLEELQKKYWNIFFNVWGAYVWIKLLESYLSWDDENKKSIIKPRIIK